MPMGSGRISMSFTPEPRQKEYRSKQNSFNMGTRSFVIPARNRSIRAFVIIPVVVIVVLQICYFIFRDGL